MTKGITQSYDDTLDQVELLMVQMGTKEAEVADFFCGGIYIRPILLEPGDKITSKVHKVDSPFFLMAGSIEIYTHNGKEILHAPHIGITKAGTRRFGSALNHVLWVSVHRTDKETVEEVEEEVIQPRINKLLSA